MNVHTRNPQFRVRFVSQKLGEFDFDTTHGSVIQLTTRKQLGEAAGSFHLSLVPRALSVIPNAGDWRDVISPMDFVEVWMWVPPRRPDRPVMRGFIDTVGQEFDIASGQPQRLVVINGRDYGKLLLITKLYDIVTQSVRLELFRKWQDGFRRLFGWDQTNPKALPPPESPPMGATQESNGPTFTPEQFLQVAWEMFYVPQEKAVLQTFSNALPGMDFVSWVKGDPWEQNLRTYSPTFFHRGTEPLMDLWPLMRVYQHIPWRELFVTEEVDQPLLVYRPTPWLDLNGDYVQDMSKVPLKTWPVGDTEIVRSVLQRSEATLVNYFFSFPEMYASFATIAKETPHALEGLMLQPLQGNPYLIGTEPGIDDPGNPLNAPSLADFRRFGLRLMETSTPYLDWERPLKEQMIARKIQDARRQGLEGNLRLVKAYGFEHLHEFGSLTLKGDERIQAGDYIALADQDRGRGGPRYYVHGVSQQFRQGTTPSDGHFITQLEVSRGRGHLVRQYQERG